MEMLNSTTHCARMQLKFISYYVLNYIIIYDVLLDYNDYATLHYSAHGEWCTYCLQGGGWSIIHMTQPSLLDQARHISLCTTWKCWIWQPNVQWCNSTAPRMIYEIILYHMIVYCIILCYIAIQRLHYTKGWCTHSLQGGGGGTFHTTPPPLTRLDSTHLSLP